MRLASKRICPKRSRSLRTDLTDGLRTNLTERRAGQVKRETRYDYAAAVAIRYQRSGREQKGWILDEFCAATGYNRKYAIKMPRGPFPRAALPPGDVRPPVYGPEEVALLRPRWQIADYLLSLGNLPRLPGTSSTPGMRRSVRCHLKPPSRRPRPNFPLTSPGHIRL
jgi:hypothetical protein